MATVTYAIEHHERASGEVVCTATRVIVENGSVRFDEVARFDSLGSRKLDAQHARHQCWLARKRREFLADHVVVCHVG